MSDRAFIKIALAALMLLAAGTSRADLYWRLDGGWSMSTDANIRDKDFDTDGLICADPACSSGAQLNDVGNSLVLQGGVGWRFDPNFRMDLTLGYRGGYKLDDSDGFPSDFKADIRSLSLLLNAYYDFSLAAWSGKPYVGAGIGFASNKIDTITNSDAFGATITVPGGTSTNRAWAFMAGFRFPLSSSMMLDVGYRYIDLGKIESDADATYSGMSGKLRAHELMIGIAF